MGDSEAKPKDAEPGQAEKGQSQDAPPSTMLGGATSALGPQQLQRKLAARRAQARAGDGAAGADTAEEKAGEAGPSKTQVSAAVSWGGDPAHGPGPETLAAIRAALGLPKGNAYDEALARAVFAKQHALGDARPDGKAGPVFCGKMEIKFERAAAPAKAEKGAKGGKGKKGDVDDGSVKLRTALDSKVVVKKEGNAYRITLHLEKAKQTPTSIDIGTYEPLADLPARQLPVYIEDFVTDEHAIVKIQYDADAVKIHVNAVDETLEGQHIQVQATAVKGGELKARAAPKARDAGPGYVAEGAENVTQHSGGSEIDKVMGSVASAEGGFASTEGSDQGIFTWGQGQWTVGANLLQPVLEFIKQQRQDLFDRYWGSAGLDVKGGVFYYEGKPWEGKAKLKELFRKDKQRDLYWVNVFAQAGQDPQIQRLQREYQRGETKDQLKEEVGGHSPDSWLNTRGKAFYYSMWVNLPSAGYANFKAAMGKAGTAKEPTDPLREAVSNEFEQLFKNSSVTARDGSGHHYIAFWGEKGRQKAVDEADKHIADPSLDKTWDKARWQKQKEAMQKRESRYEKTKADIDKALAKQNVEPDVPADAITSHE